MTSLAFSPRVRSAAVVAAVIFVGSLVPFDARATFLDPLSLAEMTASSDLIVVGQVLETQARFDSRNRIVTDVALRADEVIKGTIRQGETVTFIRVGGAIGDLGMRIEGEPAFESGEHVIVFLTLLPSGEHRVTGMSQGVVRVTEESGVRIARPDNSGLAFSNPPSGPTLAARQTLARALAAIRDVLLPVLPGSPALPNSSTRPGRSIR